MKKINALIGKGFSRPKASQKESFLFAGPLSLIFSSVKVTASDSAGVTVLMTTEDSAGYINLFSPKSARTKFRQCSMQEVTVTSRSAINGLASANRVGVCTDNLLNKNAYSALLQTAGKEKGPEVSPALLPTSVISCTGESKELHHNLPLQATRFAECQRASQALGSIPLFFISRRMMRLSHADIDSSPSCSIACRIAFSSHGSTRKAICLFPRGKLVFDICCTLGLSYRCLTMYSTFEAFVKQRSPAVLPTLTGPLTTNDNASIEVATSNYNALIERDKQSFSQTRPKFTDTYWIIPEYETTPYGKVSFTRQDRRTFIALFKDSRLIWAGRQPVQGGVNITPLDHNKYRYRSGGGSCLITSPFRTPPCR